MNLPVVATVIPILHIFPSFLPHRRAWVGLHDILSPCRTQSLSSARCQRHRGNLLFFFISEVVLFYYFFFFFISCSTSFIVTDLVQPRQPTWSPWWVTPTYLYISASKVLSWKLYTNIVTCRTCMRNCTNCFGQAGHHGLKCLPHTATAVPYCILLFPLSLRGWCWSFFFPSFLPRLATVSTTHWRVHNPALLRADRNKIKEAKTNIQKNTFKFSRIMKILMIPF